MAVGLLALLDDIAGIVKIAAASLDDIAGQAAKAGVKAAGAVIDDAAVTPNYVQGFKAALAKWLAASDAPGGGNFDTPACVHWQAEMDRLRPTLPTDIDCAEAWRSGRTRRASSACGWPSARPASTRRPS